MADKPAQKKSSSSKVQYVVQQKHVDGVGGWLVFYLIVFVLVGLSGISAFFESLTTLSSATSVVTAIFSPIITVGSIYSVVMIATQKKIGIKTSIATIGAGAVYGAVNIVVSAFETHSSDPIAITVGSIVSTLVAGGLFALYFVVSKRVKQTLTE